MYNSDFHEPLVKPKTGWYIRIRPVHVLWYAKCWKVFNLDHTDVYPGFKYVCLNLWCHNWWVCYDAMYVSVAAHMVYSVSCCKVEMSCTHVGILYHTSYAQTCGDIVFRLYSVYLTSKTSLRSTCMYIITNVIGVHIVSIPEFRSPHRA